MVERGKGKWGVRKKGRKVERWKGGRWKGGQVEGGKVYYTLLYYLPVCPFARLAVWPFVSGVIWISARPLTIYIYPIAINRISIFK